MNMYITILGSGAALPIGARRCSAQIVNIHGFKLLLDCAEATQDRIRYNHLKLQSLGTILISHLHGDHFFGLPGLLSTMHLCGRTEPVTVVAPQGARHCLETLFDYTGNHIGFPIEWVELDFEHGMRQVVANRHCSVHAFPIFHSVPTYGFRISELRDQSPLRTYSYCCDTLYDESIIPFIQGSDLLCLECTFSNQYERLATERKHLTAGQAGRLARLADVRQLLLTHISARFRDPAILLEQATAEFDNCLVAADNMRLELMFPPGLARIQSAKSEPLIDIVQK